MDNLTQSQIIKEKINADNAAFSISHEQPNQIFHEPRAIENKTFEDFQCKLNEITYNELLQKYKDLGFLYSEKKDRLLPHLKKIEDNWGKMIQAGSSLFRVVTHQDGDKWASVMHWRTTYSGWVSQHLVSNSPISSCRVMLASQADFYNSKSNECEYLQNWFRPSNRYASRVFGSITKHLPLGSAVVNEYDYYLLSKRITSGNKFLKIEKCTNDKQHGVTNFIKGVNGDLYCEAEELSRYDIELKELNEAYKKNGLFRKRETWIAYDSALNILGAAILYIAPVGINFSFIENRCEIVLKEDLVEEREADVIGSLLEFVSNEMSGQLSCMPVILKRSKRSVMNALSLPLVREYNQSIWTRRGFSSWHHYVESLFEKTLKRESSKTKKEAAINYFMDDEREASRLKEKVNAPDFVSKYISPHVITSKEQILDVGCGPGVIASAVASHHKSTEVYGVDLSKDRIALAKRSTLNLKNMYFERAEASCLPFVDNKFDLIYTRFLLEYLKYPENVLKEFKRVGKHGGKLIMQDLDGQLVTHYPIKNEFENRINVIIEALKKTGFDPYIGRKLYYMAINAGLKNIKVVIEPYHQIIGKINDRELYLWKLKLDIARPQIIKAFNSKELADKTIKDYLDYFKQKDTLSFSNMFTITGTWE
jgi:ubiquinone/menaquinone biosynthesis C-methylase UbiE